MLVNQLPVLNFLYCLWLGAGQKQPVGLFLNIGETLPTLYLHTHLWGGSVWLVYRHDCRAYWRLEFALKLTGYDTKQQGLATAEAIDGNSFSLSGQPI